MIIILTKSDRNNFRPIDDIKILDFTDFKIPTDIFTKSDRVVYIDKTQTAVFLKNRFENLETLHKVGEVFLLEHVHIGELNDPIEDCMS